MIFPMMQITKRPTEKQVIEFKGYDVQNVIDPGSMRDMKNMSSDEYPCLYQRRPRKTVSDIYNNPSAILPRDDKLAVCDATSFWYDEEIIFDFESDYEGERIMQAINTRIVIWPDKMFYNTETGEYGSLAAEVHPASVTFSRDATTHETCAEFTLDTGDTLEAFKKGDAITFSGMSTSVTDFETGEDNNIQNAIIEKINYAENKMWFAEGVIHYPTSDYADFTDTGETSLGFTILREVPDLDFILEYNNRLYGTKGNTIMASKLGDPTNWFCYGTGTADSSYAVDVSSDGDFTGIAPFPDHIVFFKENCIHKLYGYKPSNYQLITTMCLGLERGSHKSAVLVNGSLFYKSREGIMIYTGSVPYLISQNFGRKRFDSVAAGTDYVKYYVSMRDIDRNKWCLFVYDIDRALWHLEDDTHALGFAHVGRELMYSDSDKGQIMAVYADDADEEGPIEWYARFGEYDEYSKIEMRLKMEEHSQLNVWISVDGGAWERVYHLDTFFKRTVEMPIIPRRCDKFEILLAGEGYVKIESMVRLVREGTIR